MCFVYSKNVSASDNIIPDKVISPKRYLLKTCYSPRFVHREWAVSQNGR